MSRTPPSAARRKILEEAIRIVSAEGASRVTMRSLGEKLGASAGVIYLHFRNKEDLLQEIALHGFDELAEAMAPALGIEDVEDAMADAGRRYVAFGLEHPELYRLMFQEISLASAALAPEDDQRRRRAWEITRTLYARGLAAGRFREDDPDVAASIGWALAHGFVELAKPGRLLDAGAGADAIVALREQVIAAWRRSLRP